MNKAAESEDRQSYFYYLKLAEETLQRQDPECSEASGLIQRITLALKTHSRPNDDFLSR